MCAMCQFNWQDATVGHSLLRKFRVGATLFLSVRASYLQQRGCPDAAAVHV